MGILRLVAAVQLLQTVGISDVSSNGKVLSRHPLSLWMAIAVLLSGCQIPHPADQPNVPSERAGPASVPVSSDGTRIVPEGVHLDDGLSSDEAVTLALWNNAQFRELLAQLGTSRAQLYDAGLLSDPQLVIFFPIGTKQLEFTTFQALDALWLRPIRQRAAEFDLLALSHQMVQHGLDTARNVRIAHADLLLAQQTAELTARGHRLAEEIAALAGKRLEAGDISELEVTTSQIEALQAKATAANAAVDVRIAQSRLGTLAGVPGNSEALHATDEQHVGEPDEGLAELLAIAFAVRPDLQAIQIRREAACERTRLARNQFMNLDAVFDSNEQGTDGFEAGPGVRMTLPIFNGNKGAIAIAEAQVEQVNRQLVAARDRIELEVRTALAQLQQAAEQTRLLDSEVLPALTRAEQLARRNYEDGGVSYFLVLRTTGQFIDAQRRRYEAVANFRRARAELERSIGRKLQHIDDSQVPTITPKLLPLP